MKNFTILVLTLTILGFYANAQKADKGNHLIDENRVWEYVKYERKIDNEEKTYLFSRYGFIGTEEKYGKEYAVWTLINETKYHLPGYDLTDPSQGENRKWEVETTAINRPVALLRENRGKVYMLPDRELSKYDPATKQTLPYSLPEGEDVLLYDFSVEQGEWMFDMLYNSFCLTPAYVTEVGFVAVGQEDMRSYSIITSCEDSSQDPSATDYASIKCVESVGVVTEGTLTDIFTTAYTPVPSYSIDGQGFYALYDSEGKILYKSQRLDFPEIAGFSDLENHKVTKDVKYDLMGREIREPLPGTVYIRNGKKFVGK